MKEVIAFYTQLANYMDENGLIESAEDLTEKAIKTAQTNVQKTSPSIGAFEQMVQQDASRAADLVMKGMKGELSKQDVKQQLESMMQKQESYKFNNNITQNDENVLLNKILKKNTQQQKVQTPVFRSVQEAENFYNQKHNFSSPQEAQKFQADKMRFMKSIGK